MQLIARFFALFGLLATSTMLTAAPALPIYQPKVVTNDIYAYNPGLKPALRYNHDVDIAKFRGRYIAAWNANEVAAEDVPGQFNFISVSDDFETWSPAAKMFTKENGTQNPVETDNQWQPNFINWKDEVLFCAWSDFVARRVYIASSKDGTRWNNVEVPNAPAALQGKASGFPTNHGLVTSKGVMLFPCSIPFTDTPRAMVGKTQFAGVLRSSDGGKTWTWSDPIEAMSWSQAGENPKDFGGETITLWEPMLFEQADGKIGLLIRNSTAQENPERLEKPHRMLLYAQSSDQGQTWTKARTVEVDTICSRNYAVSGVNGRDSLLMVMNDNNVRVPERINKDRYFLSLYCAPTSDPDLLLPGPIVQPDGGTAYYPNGFVEKNTLYLAYSYANIQTSTVSPLPDFSRPFLLPRGGRSGLRLEGDLAYFGQRQSSLGLVLTEALTKQPTLKLSFDINMVRYDGNERILLTLGGKTHHGTVLRAIYNKETQTNVLQIRGRNNQWIELSAFQLKGWNHVDVELGEKSCSFSVNRALAKSLDFSVLRKISFGGLYVPPDWPMGVSRSADIRLKLDTISVK